MRRQVDHHTSGIIIESATGREFLLGRYDDGYPHVEFRNTHTLIGGNYEPEDVNPLELLIREVKEKLEFTTEKEEFAPKNGRRTISAEILVDVVRECKRLC